MTLANVDSNITANFAFDSGFTGKTSRTENAAALGTNVIVTDGETTNFKFYANALDKKSVEIIGNAKNNSILGGSGNDVITDYTAGQDKIKLSDATISNYYFDGADVIFNTSEGSVTVQNARDKKITLLDSNNKTSYWFDGSPNFIKAENQISSLMKVADTNYSVGDIYVP